MGGMTSLGKEERVGGWEDGREVDCVTSFLELVPSPTSFVWDECV